MPSLSDLVAYARFAVGLPRALRYRLSPEESRGIVQERLRQRSQMLLDLLERRVYAVPSSPYRELLRNAGCELGDAQRLIVEEGVEGALGVLRDEGVYVTFEEFKGRRPIVRSGREVATDSRSFNNPRTGRYWHGSTSGSTGPGTRIALDLEHLVATTPSSSVTMDAHGVLGIPAATWRTILPGLAGVSTVLHSAMRGQPMERWFSPVSRAEVRPSLKNRVATEWIVAVGRLSGRRIPRPELVPLEDAEIVARWMHEAIRREGACLLQAHVSCLLRAAHAARDLGLDLSGATFWGGGEPPTPAKVAPLLEVGGRYLSTYYMAEAGVIGLACTAPRDATDVHVMEDSIAVIQRPVQVSGSRQVVQAFHFTTLLPTAPKLLFNVESDDFGILEERVCECPLNGLGLTRHIRQVASYRKLTGEGMSLVGTDMIRILEEVLPRTYGGTALDFQLAQEEDADGFTKLALLVHPRLSVADESAVITTVLEELGKSDDGAELARAVWRQAGTISVRREAPRPGAMGKHAPLVTLTGDPGGAR